MNFVDVQPKSFLDYAWTSPSPAGIKPAKPSKAGRKQNRCCDQCRKGKRACDAAILEDTLLDDSKSGGNPTVFHYSDVFGPLTACGNCDKTKKTCTFDWLRSQRVLQASSQPQPGTAPPAKRRRTKSTSSGPSRNQHETDEATHGAESTIELGTSNESSASRVSPVELGELGVTFGDFPSGASVFDTDPSISLFEMIPSIFGSGGEARTQRSCLDTFSGVFEDDMTPAGYDSGKGSSLETLSDDLNDRTESVSPYTANAISEEKKSTKPNGTVMRCSRKRRRRSSSGSISYGALPCPAISYANDILSSTNRVYLTEGLLRIYHSSFENALSCWLTERTCPYSARTDIILTNGATPDWNRIYHRVSRLDRLAASIRGRQLTFVEDKAASKSLDMAIYAFASQWAQSSQRGRTKYPFRSDGLNSGTNVFDAGEDESIPAGTEFDRALQTSTWYEARNALEIAGDIESFRVVLAQIVFAMTQKPVGNDEDEQNRRTDSKMVDMDDGTETMSPVAEEEEISECEDLMSRLNLAIDTEGPPVHLEKGLRLIHSLRSRMAMLGDKSRINPSGLSRSAKRYRRSADCLDVTDRATVDLLFWLGVMFDTLSAAMHKRPLVVSDEDSNIYPNEPSLVATSNGNGAEIVPVGTPNGLWDDYLFAHQNKRLQAHPTRWPCSFDQAATLLCDAAPVKILLFRKVTRIQTLLARNFRDEEIEKAIQAALDVCDHWSRLYAPFVQDCIQNHDRLPSRIQSWYICLTGHWHLATLLLVDLIEIVDESELGIEEIRNKRNSSDFVACFRERNCRTLSDLARSACPREDATFSQSREFHFAVSEGALLTEPWTAVLIRAFAKAGVVLLELEERVSIHSSTDGKDVFRRADDCVKALWFLGRKSDMALSAAKILGDALKQRRKGAQEKVNDMSTFLEAELWHGFEEFDEAFRVDCE